PCFLYNPSPLTPGVTGPMTLKGKRILLGLTGGIAAYKAAALARALAKAGCDVRVAMSEAATRFITPVTMQALTGQTVWPDLWDPRMGGQKATQRTQPGDTPATA